MKLLAISERSIRAAGQFARYLIAGGIGAAVEIVLFALLAWKVFPALKEDEWVVRWFDLAVVPIEPAHRALNFALCMSITFIISNWVGYILNAKWVFTPGRYSRRKEIALFYIAALLSYISGTMLGSSMIAILGTTSTTAYVAVTVVSVLINFSVRKFIIFKG